MTDRTCADFSNDNPIAHKADDRLNRSPFAERIASVIVNLPKNISLVIGINGQWGDGKTTILNLIRNDLSNNSKILVQNFNPWRLTDEEKIFRGYFSLLSNALGTLLSTKTERTKKWTKKLIRLIRIITKPLGLVFKPLETIDMLLSEFADAVASGDSIEIEELRNRIIAHLYETDKKIVIMIDDIDRLDRNEAHLLFRTIKACADFPNIIYILAFDDRAVARALGVQYGTGDEQAGRAFLEKIIQIPLNLPVAAKEDLRTLCFEQIEHALNVSDIELTKSQVGELVSNFDRCILIRVTNPRSTKRFGNGLMFAIPMLIGEVNYVDLILIEALKAFYIELYRIIRENYANFCGVNDSTTTKEDAPLPIKKVIDQIKTMPQEESSAAQFLLISLFPRISFYFNRSNFKNDRIETWTKEKRISAPRYCYKYFTYSISTSDISDIEIQNIIIAAKSGDKASLKATLINHFERHAKSIIEKFRDIENTVEENIVDILATSIAELANKIPNPQILFTWAAPPSQAAIFLSHILKRINDLKKRVEVATSIMSVAEPLWFAAECIRWLHTSDKPENIDNNTLTNEELISVRNTLVKRIKQKSAEGRPLFDPEIQQEQSLLYEWRRSEGIAPVQEHLVNTFNNNPQKIILFLQAMAPIAQGVDDAIPRPGNLISNSLKSIQWLIDPDVLAQLIKDNFTGNFVNPIYDNPTKISQEQRLTEQFFSLYNSWINEGRPQDKDDNQ